MASIRSIEAAILGLAMSCSADAVEVPRIDASTDSSAQASWDNMYEGSSSEAKCHLRAALVQITSATAAEKGLHALSLHAAMQDPSVVRIKDRLSGLSAGQIVELGQQLSPGKVVCGAG